MVRSGALLCSTDELSDVLLEEGVGVGITETTVTVVNTGVGVVDRASLVKKAQALCSAEYVCVV
jgi:hypothetical protein